MLGLTATRRTNPSEGKAMPGGTASCRAQAEAALEAADRQVTASTERARALLARHAEHTEASTRLSAERDQLAERYRAAIAALAEGDPTTGPHDALTAIEEAQAHWQREATRVDASLTALSTAIDENARALKTATLDRTRRHLALLDLDLTASDARLTEATATYRVELVARVEAMTLWRAVRAQLAVLERTPPPAYPFSTDVVLALGRLSTLRSHFTDDSWRLLR